MRILLVDDEQELTQPLSQLLVQEGYSVDVAADGWSGEALATANIYDLYILDWVLPGKSGIEICRSLRRQNNTKPVLFLTAQDTLDDRVQGLDAGADDYLVKPFELRELLARIRALLRRGQLEGQSDVPAKTGDQDRKLQAADLTLDVESQIAYRASKIIELSEKEAQLLAYLMTNAGRLVTHQQIHEQLWGNSTDAPSSNVLAALMRLLRRKLSIDSLPELIYTVYGKGYQFGSPS
jgi:two-component system, OmpR family, manganese sensing response regulator